MSCTSWRKSPQGRYEQFKVLLQLLRCVPAVLVQYLARARLIPDIRIRTRIITMPHSSVISAGTGGLGNRWGYKQCLEREEGSWKRARKPYKRFLLSTVPRWRWRVAVPFAFPPSAMPKAAKRSSISTLGGWRRRHKQRLGARLCQGRVPGRRGVPHRPDAWCGLEDPLKTHEANTPCCPKPCSLFQLTAHKNTCSSSKVRDTFSFKEVSPCK